MAKLALQGNDAGTGTFTLRAPATNLNRNLVLPDVDGTLSTMEQVKLPIGSFMWFTGASAPEAFVVADGQLRSRAAFPDLWAFAQTSGNISVDDASWTFGQYSPGDGSTTFRVPKVDDRFIRGKSGSRAVGLVEEDAIRNIVGTFVGGVSNKPGTGAFYISKLDAGNLGDGTGNREDRYGFDASLVVPTADENRPKALTMLPCIKAYDVISDPNVLNAVEVVNEISRLESEKMRKDENINLGVSVVASGTAVDFVGIPEGVKRITVMFNGVSTNGSSPPMVQLGSGTYIDSGYNGSVHGGSSTFTGVLHTNGFRLDSFTGVSNTRNGSAILSYVGNNRWAIASSMSLSDVAASAVSSGTVLLTGTLDRLRIINQNGTDQFDAGTINISWEF